MTIALWCVFVAAVFPIVCTTIAKAGRLRDYDNRSPRDWLGKLEGYRARANAAQQNSWEALAIFSAGVFAAHLAQAPQGRLDTLAMIFIGLRVIYLICYLANLASLRSAVWMAAFGVSLALFFI
jgi:uncharacterized MAPEG superfamily protein